MRSSSSIAVGLRILIADDACNSTTHRQCYKLVIHSYCLNSVKPIFHITSPLAPPPPNYGSLKSCFRCGKNLRLDKDVYMYRGDQGFCSEACRGRQIYLDEIREIENKTAQTLASFRCRPDSSNGNRCRAGEGFRQRHRQQAPIFTLP